MMRAVSDWVDIQWTVINTSLKSVAPRARGRLLDVGCGNKPYEAIFKPYVSEYLGIEHESTFELTSASDDGSRPDFVYDGVTLPFPNRSFDTVLNIQVLEHTPHPGRLVNEMSRVLNDNGLLISPARRTSRLLPLQPAWAAASLRRGGSGSDGNPAARQSMECDRS